MTGLTIVKPCSKPMPKVENTAVYYFVTFIGKGNNMPQVEKEIAEKLGNRWLHSLEAKLGEKEIANRWREFYVACVRYCGERNICRELKGKEKIKTTECVLCVMRDLLAHRLGVNHGYVKGKR